MSAWNLIPWKATQHHHTQKRIANAQQDVHHEQTDQVEELGAVAMTLQVQKTSKNITFKIKSFDLCQET